MENASTKVAIEFKPGDLVKVRSREWVVLPETRDDLLRLRPLGGSETDASLIYLPLEPEKPTSATFDLPDPNRSGPQEAGLLLRDALRLKLRAGAGPFRSFGNLNVEPRAYQLVPLLMALKLETVRLLVADDVGIGKTIEAGLIARELLDRGEIERLAVICPPHLCEQWQQELTEKFNIKAEVVRTGTITRLERSLLPDESVFNAYPFTVVSLDYIKSDRRREDFLRTCPEFVICDEAHTCTQSNTNTRHQRYQLLKGLAESNPPRGLVLLTATPHSGDDTAFHHLLGLLDPKFTELADLPEGATRRSLREDLALHFVQRRRGDIAEWNDEDTFPIRESREATYRLTGEWGQLFDDVLAYARTMVQRTEGGSKLEQRMSWWAALALLRCASSSPATVSLALKTRLEAVSRDKGETAEEKVSSLDSTARESVMDEVTDDSLASTESTPAGTINRVEDSAALSELISRADELRGPKKDAKLNTLIEEIRKLVNNRFRPVVFCRYIETAHYVGDGLCNALSETEINVIVITGELTPDQREERVDNLADLDDEIIPVLVATDCLSEGVNLQNHFNAVVHYDLTWNPTRHEQREGRADRFGQKSRKVRALMLYGENNPVDGAVLCVIIRKAEKIRKELGVSVPLPADNNKVIEAIMNTVLHKSGVHSRVVQSTLDFGDIEAEVDDAWQRATSRSKPTVFAQRRLTPNEVLPEYRKAYSVLGGSTDVARFVRLSAARLNAPLDERNGYYRLPVAHLPDPLQERFDAIGFTGSAKLAFEQPTPVGATYIHRTHPLVTTLADFVAEQALDPGLPDTDIVARSGAIFTSGVTVRTVLYLLRLRSHLLVERRGIDGQFSPFKSLLAEECLGVAIQGSNSPELLTEDKALSLLCLEPARNMEKEQQIHLIRQAIGALSNLENAFENVAHEQTRRLLDDHRRIREASNTKGLRYRVAPALPVDKIGIFVFVPQTIF